MSTYCISSRGWVHEDVDCEASHLNCRPVVVIDPDNAEHVAALHDALVGDNWYGSRGYLQAALRSLVPPPRPPEPKGWGAVVKDENGWYWVLVSPETRAWHNAGASHPRMWTDISVARIVSEGVS